MLDLAVLPERAPQQVRLVDALLPVLGHMPPSGGGYVHCLRHTATLAPSPGKVIHDTPILVATHTTQKEPPSLAAQGKAAQISRNFGLTGRRPGTGSGPQPSRRTGPRPPR